MTELWCSCGLRYSDRRAHMQHRPNPDPNPMPHVHIACLRCPIPERAWWWITWAGIVLLCALIWLIPRTIGT